MRLLGYKRFHVFQWVQCSALALFFGLDLQAADRESGEFSLSVGMDYSSGDYGLAKETEMRYLPLTLTYERFPWRTAVTLSHLRITGPGGVIGGGDGSVIVGASGKGSGSGGRGGPGGGKRGLSTEQGLGDIVASLSYALDSLWNLPVALDLIGKVKFATADAEKGLGTGENDYVLQFDIADSYDRFTPFATLGYRAMGDPPDLDLHDVWFSSIGFDYRLSPSLNSGTSFDYRQATSSAAAPQRELVAYLNWKIGGSWSINGYAVVGFSTSSPDAAVGIQLDFKP